MAVHEITKAHVKQWVVNNAAVNNPYKKKWWYAAVSIGYDYAGKGETIEKAYNDLVEQVVTSPFMMSQLYLIKVFEAILKSKP